MEWLAVPLTTTVKLAACAIGTSAQSSKAHVDTILHERVYDTLTIDQASNLYAPQLRSAARTTGVEQSRY